MFLVSARVRALGARVSAPGAAKSQRARGSARSEAVQPLLQPPGAGAGPKVGLGYLKGSSSNHHHRTMIREVKPGFDKFRTLALKL